MAHTDSGSVAEAGKSSGCKPGDGSGVSVISVEWMSRDRQPGIDGARSSKLPYAA